MIDIIRELQQYSISVDVFDPYADKQDVKNNYGIELIDKISKTYSGIILAVSHEAFLNIKFENSASTAIFDVKGFLSKGIADGIL